MAAAIGEPNSGLRILRQALEKNGASRCPSPHGGYWDVVDQQIQAMDDVNKTTVEAIGKAKNKRDAQGASTLYVDPRDVAQIGHEHFWKEVSEGNMAMMQEATTYNAFRVAVSWRAADSKPRPLAANMFYADITRQKRHIKLRARSTWRVPLKVISGSTRSEPTATCRTSKRGARVWLFHLGKQ